MDHDLRTIIPLCPEPENCILGLCPSCSQSTEESTCSEAPCQGTHTTSPTYVEGPFLEATAPGEPPRSTAVVTHSPSRPQQALALNPQYTQQTSFSQVSHLSQRQASSQQFILMCHNLQPGMQLCIETHLSSADKQVQSSQSAHQGQLDTNLQLTGHPVDWGQAMIIRKTEDKKSRKPLTGAEKVDIINYVRGENGQGKPYRQVSKEIGYPISTISRVVKEWREEIAASTASVICKSALTRTRV
ncbi:MAG: hypothetical protein J3Q66DRAFT_373516 [Benniella sp.]|nr:MAG: hypothetical protein J3Q66DRAFT_373516 [Benniella sp.]